MRWLKLPALLTLLLVVASELLTDRVPALQFLWWVPRIALLLPALLWLLALLGMTWVIKDSANDRKRLAMWLAVAVVVAGIVLSRDFGFPAARPPQSLRLVHRADRSRQRRGRIVGAHQPSGRDAGRPQGCAGIAPRQRQIRTVAD